jgi:hypothetical protein
MIKKNELIIKKPNQTIMISNGVITASQRKAYNVLLHKASQDLILNNNQVSFYISIHDIKEKAGIKATDNWHLKEDLKQLKKFDIEVVKDNGDWAIFSLLSEIEKEGNLLKYVLSEKIRQAILDNDYYTTLDLMTMKSLQGKHSIIIYELAIRYCKVEIPKLTIEEFRKLTGTENYGDWAQIKAKVIDPAIKEINEKTDIILDYQIFKSGRKIIALKFIITNKLKSIKEEISKEFPEDYILIVKSIPEIHRGACIDITFEIFNKCGGEVLSWYIDYTLKMKPNNNFGGYINKIYNAKLYDQELNTKKILLDNQNKNKIIEEESEKRKFIEEQEILNKKIMQETKEKEKAQLFSKLSEAELNKWKDKFFKDVLSNNSFLMKRYKNKGYNDFLVKTNLQLFIFPS